MSNYRKNKPKNKRKNKRKNNSNQNTLKEYYTELNNEYMKKYEEYTGINANDTSSKKFTEAQQIERYAKNIAFWEKEYIKPSPNHTAEMTARSFLVSHARVEMIQKIKDMFPEDVIKKIMDRSAQLLDNNRCEEINKIREDLQIKYNRSIELHKKLIDDIGEENGKNILDPANWICNQNIMRSTWENMQSECEKNSSVDKIILNNNPFAEYMIFMYESYPANYCTKMMEYKNTGYCDSAEVYYELTHL